MIVVDASIGFKWLFTQNENYLKKANQLLKQHLSQEVKITIPDIFLYEISNAIATKSTIPSRKATFLIDKLISFELLIKHPTSQELKKSLHML